MTRDEFPIWLDGFIRMKDELTPLELTMVKEELKSIMQQKLTLGPPVTYPHVYTIPCGTKDPMAPPWNPTCNNSL